MANANLSKVPSATPQKPARAEQFTGIDPWILERAHPDDVPVILTALEDVVQVSEALEAATMFFEEGSDIPAGIAVDLLKPVSEKLSSVVSNFFPDLAIIRKHWAETGRDREIQGG